MRLHRPALHLILTILARHFYFGYYLPCDSGGVPCDFRVATAGTMAKLLEDVLYALFAVDFGAARRLDCIFGKFKA